MPFDPSTFWDRHAEIARELSGAHHSSWDGRIETGFREFSARQINESQVRIKYGPDAMDPGNGELERRRSAVQWTGTIRYDADRVVAPLNQMLDRADREEFTDDELRGYRTALRAALQAHGHLLAPEGQDYTDGQIVKRYGWANVIDRGISEAWARHDLDRFIDRLELPERLTGALKTVDAEYDDPIATAAAEQLATRIAADHPSAEYGDVLLSLNNQTPLGNMPEAARLAFEAGPLAQAPLPPIVAQDARERIEDSLFATWAETSPATSEADRRGDVPVAEQLREGTRIGDETYRAARTTTAAIEDTVREFGGDRLATMRHADAMSTSPGQDPPLEARAPQKRFGPRTRTSGPPDLGRG